MKNALFLIFSIFFSVGASAQDLDLYYNLHTDKVEYKRNGKLLKKPKLKKGGTINFHVSEFNNYLYDVKLEVEESTKSSGLSGMSGLSQMLSMAGIGGGMPDILGGLGINGFAGEGEEEYYDESEEQDSTKGNFSSFLDIPIITVNDSPITLKNLFGKSRGAAQIMEQTTVAMQEVSQAVEEIQMLYGEVKKYEKAIIVSEFAEESLDRLKFDPSIKPSTIKKLAGEYYEALFFKPAETAEPSLEDILIWREMPQKYASLHGRLGTKKEKLAQKTKTLQLLSGQLSGIEEEDADLDDYLSGAFAVSKKALKLNKDLDNWMSQADPNAAQKRIRSPREVTELQLKFAEILENDFWWHSSILTTGDVVGIKFQLIFRPRNVDESEGEVVQTRTFEFTASGGLKISAGAGINFAQFSSPAQSFDVNNGVIIADDAGVFNPSVASLVHFFRNNPNGATFGGSFGMGLPMLSGDNQNIQFYLGPSLHFGSSQKIILTGGVMTGKVNRLSRGFKAGDAFDLNDGDIPVKGKYELGYFLGISFGFAGN